MSEHAGLYIYIVEPFWDRQQYENAGLKVAEISDRIGRLKKRLGRFRLPTFIMADYKPSVRHFKFYRHLIFKTVCQEEKAV